MLMVIRLKTIFNDNTFISAKYDPLGREISETDQGGKTKEYSYDAKEI